MSTHCIPLTADYGLAPLDLHVRAEVLFDFERGHGLMTPCKAKRIVSRPNKSLAFDITLTNGGTFAHVPIHMLVFDLCAIVVKEEYDMPWYAAPPCLGADGAIGPRAHRPTTIAWHQKALEQLQRWDCFCSKFVAVPPDTQRFWYHHWNLDGTKSYIECQALLYVDWYGPPANSYGPAGHKSALVGRRLCDGHLVAQPNTRICVKDPAYVRPFALTGIIPPFKLRGDDWPDSAEAGEFTAVKRNDRYHHDEEVPSQLSGQPGLKCDGCRFLVEGRERLLCGLAGAANMENPSRTLGTLGSTVYRPAWCPGYTAKTSGSALPLPATPDAS